MVKVRLRRQTIALIAAYAVALQGLLLSFVPLAPAALTGPFAILCSHDAVDGPGQPAKHDLPCAALCAALGYGVTGPLPPAVTTLAAEFRMFQAVVPTSPWTPPRIARTEPHAARGPPIV